MIPQAIPTGRIQLSVAFGECKPRSTISTNPKPPAKQVVKNAIVQQGMIKNAVRLKT